MTLIPKTSFISMQDNMLERTKASAIEALNKDMRRNTSPIKKELDALILEAQKQSVSKSEPRTK